MKKLILPLIILLIFLIPGLKVDADECVNLYSDPPGTLFQTGSGSWIYYNSQTISLDSSKNYIFYATLDGQLVDRLLLPDTGAIGLNGTNLIPLGFTGNTHSIKNKTSFNFYYMNPPENELAIYQSWQFWIVEGTEVCIPTTEPEEPVPEEPAIIPDTTLDNFYSIYFEKLTSLSNFVTENRFVLFAITILLFVCCLELFLYLVRRRKT